MKFYTRFNPPASPGLKCLDESLAHQEFEPECNINNILAKFKVTGVLVDPAVRSLRQPMFIDCTSIPDLEEYHNRLNDCKKSFDNLPREIQEAFGFDARIAMQWLSNATDRQVVRLFNKFASGKAKGGLGGASTPQNKPENNSAANQVAEPAAEVNSDVPAQAPSVSTT